MSEIQTSAKSGNPYVGPRPFQRGEILYGRHREVSKLLNLLIAERIVTLYSPSGAGKTSLLRAALIPRLEKKRFEVWPIMRVNQELPPDEPLPAGTNRYIYSLLDYLERELPESEQIPAAELAQLTLVDYLERRRAGQDNPPRAVLIFDQFEEILTIDPTNLPAKRAFFEQVGQALQQRWVWAIFSLREDYIAGLDPFLLPIPNRLNTTFRLELLDKNAARQAMKGPANEKDVTFSDEAADKLVNDLSLVRIQQRDGTIVEKEGLYVEPVQLQVVCRRLWAGKFPPGAPLPAEGAIVAEDVERVGDVDSALAGYYAERVKAIAAETGVSERAIRDWCGEALITETGIRGQVLSGLNQGLDEAAAQGLVDAHLVRAEERRGSTWYELAHDRLIEPVRESNIAWEEEHLHPLQRQAALWDKEERPEGLLLTGDALIDAEQWAETQAEILTSAENEFLAQSKKARADAELRLKAAEDAVRVETNRRRIKQIAALAIVALVLAIIAVIFGVQANNNKIEAEENATGAIQQAERANNESIIAKTAQAKAVAVLTAAEEIQLSIGATATEQQQIAKNALDTVEALEVAQRDAIEQKELAEATVIKIQKTLEALQSEMRLLEEKRIQEISNAEILLSTAIAASNISEAERIAAEARIAIIRATQTAAIGAATATVVQQELDIKATQTSIRMATETAIARPTTTPTKTASPTSPPMPTATPTPIICNSEPTGEFRDVWAKNKNRLGCPTQIDPTIYGNFAEQRFESGFMFWSEFQNSVIAVQTTEPKTWFLALNWSFVPGGSICANNHSPNLGPGQYLPVNAFGGVWCDSATVREALGFATAPERGMGGAIQAFERGYILRNDNQNRKYVLFEANRSVVVEADLRSWSQQGRLDYGEWVVSSDGESVLQRSNGHPTFFINPDPILNSTVRIGVRVEDDRPLDEADDDYIGLVFGYKAPYQATGNENDNYDLYLFDWKRQTQDDPEEKDGTAYVGFSIARVDGKIPFNTQTASHPGFWDHHANIDQFALKRDPLNKNDEGWQPNRDYMIELTYRTGSVTVTVFDIDNGEKKFNHTISGTFPAARFGFYNYAVPNARYWLIE